MRRGPLPGTKRRARAHEPLARVNVEIQEKNYAFVKDLAASMGISIAMYMDSLVEWHREKHERTPQHQK